VAALSGLLMLGGNMPQQSSVMALVRVVAIAAAAGLLARVVPPLPGILVAYGRYAATWVGQNEIVYVGEGVTASVAVSRTPSGALNYHNAGKVQASSEPQDMRLQRMLGHITTLVPKNPNKVLVIGCGAGVTAGAVSVDPLVKDQTIAEIEPLVPQVVSTHFSEHNFDVVRNPKVKVHLDDARHYLLTTNEKFDAITSDPLDPWVKGAATLYTREFFQVVKAHLNPGGVVTLFVQLYESTEEAAKSEIKTFLEAFPNGAVFANTINGQGYDLVLFGQLEDAKIDVDAVQARLVAARDRHQLGGGAVWHLRRPALRHGRLAEGRHHQHRSQPEAAVPGRPRAEPLSQRRDLQGDDPGQQVSRRAVRGVAGDVERAASPDRRFARGSAELEDQAPGSRLRAPGPVWACDRSLRNREVFDPLQLGGPRSCHR
jgi:spermidine synthase